ncbi:MAG: hypothetical protein PHP80_05670 [Synergistaceae bacterium]|nr:hypothetical protein [Synergistaceae bacterium]
MKRIEKIAFMKKIHQQYRFRATMRSGSGELKQENRVTKLMI